MARSLEEVASSLSPRLVVTPAQTRTDRGLEKASNSGFHASQPPPFWPSIHPFLKAAVVAVSTVLRSRGSLVLTAPQGPAPLAKAETALVLTQVFESSTASEFHRPPMPAFLPPSSFSIDRE